jgi:hypothetical protein
MERNNRDVGLPKVALLFGRCLELDEGVHRKD